MPELSWLVERSRAGDLDAFTEVLRHFQDMAHGYAYSILGDFHLAQDAAQEAFVEAYYKLDALREPAAFPGWFRRIVFKQCERITRKKEVATVSLEEAMHVPHPHPERSELQERVLDAIRGLPAGQREATTLYYINGYSQNEIAEFLEVPVTTVQKRLHDSRKKLKERMLGMVEETLKNNAPDERFSQNVIAELLGRPNLLQIEGHPVQEILKAIRAALPEYEFVEGEEVISKEDPNGVYPVEMPNDAYHVDARRVLRTSTTPIVMRTVTGRKPPIRLITAGRAFRSGVCEHAVRANVFHMVDVLCIDPGVTLQDMQEVFGRAVSSALGAVQVRWAAHDQFQGFADCVEAYIERNNNQIEIGAGGMLSREMLVKAGFDPAAVAGFCFGVGLERLTIVKLGLDDIHILWLAPYVKQG